MTHLFKVTTKAAIYNRDRSKVLVIDIDQNGDWGLPGGHIEENEQMDDAVCRELMEECGAKFQTLKKADFFRHSNGKIVLAYVGILKDDTVTSMQDNKEGIPKWLTRQEFETIVIEPAYRKLVLNNWE